MSDEILKRDDNRVTVGAGVTDDSNKEIRMFRLDPVSKRLKVSAEFPGNTDGRIKVSSDDTTFNYLESKLVAGSGVTLTVNNPGGNETITVSASGTSFYTTMQDNGTPLTQRENLNFVDFFTLTDNSGDNSTEVSINVTELGGDSTFVSTLETNLDLGDISGVIDLSTQVTGLLDVANIDVVSLANDSTFIDELSSNATFVSNLAGNTTFTSALDLGDIGGSLDLSTQVTGVLDSDNIDVTDLAANATFISAMETSLDLANISGQIDLTTQATGILPLVNGGTGAALTDPNADRILFWDDSAGATAFLTVGAGLSISGTILSATPSANSVSIQDDFLGTPKQSGVITDGQSFSIGTLPWVAKNSSSTDDVGTFANGEANHPGIFVVGDGGSGAQDESITLGTQDSTTFLPIYAFAEEGNSYNFIVKPVQENTNDIAFVLIGNPAVIGVTTMPTNSVRAVFDEASGNILFQTSDSTTTQQSTIQAYTISNWYNISFVMTASGVAMYLGENGATPTLVATHTTNVPSTTALGTAQVYTQDEWELAIDYFKMDISNLTR